MHTCICNTMMIFKVSFQGKETVIPISPEDQTLITIFDKGGVSYVSASTLDNDLKQHTWLENSSSVIDDSISVEISEASKKTSQPMRTIVTEKVNRKSKLEFFIELENELKHRGLL